MNYETYMEYFLDLKNTFQSGYEGVQPEKEMDKDFEKTFLSNLLDKVKEAWYEYKSITRESYLLTEEELEHIWNSSKEEMLNNMLASLSDKGYINTGINSNGEIVYSISEDGKDYLDHISESK